MEKHEVTFFKNHYIDYLKKRNDSDVCMWLENAIDFEEPDGYYFDSKNDLLVIFEHFDIDCSERIIKKDKDHGSILRKNCNDKYKEVNREIQASVDYYQSTKVIEQGYCKQDGNNKTFYIGQDGDKYRDNFINNFYKSFEYHCKKIEDYKKNVVEKVKIQPLVIKVCFLVEDKTILGTHYSNEKNFLGDPVVLTDTLQFQSKINNSNVDCVVFGQQHEIIGVGYKGDSELNKIDLSKRDFFVFPAIPLITASKKIKLI